MNKIAAYSRNIKITGITELKNHISSGREGNYQTKKLIRFIGRVFRHACDILYRKDLQALDHG